MYGLSLLHKAVLKSIDLVNLLLKNGAEPNIKDNTGATPLSLAAQAQKLDVVRVLYQHGCDIFHKDNSGKRPIDWILPVPLFEEFISELKTAHGEEFIHKLK
uniref:Uncharacterized protein n=1 Tax=Arcella intermedia TaxID=1963864 RepID=A0A6B2LRV6_9EUKA